MSIPLVLCAESTCRLLLCPSPGPGARARNSRAQTKRPASRSLPRPPPSPGFSRGFRTTRLVSMALAPKNQASPGRSDRTTCLRPRNKGLVACGGGLEVMNSQAGALVGLRAPVTPCSVQLRRPPWHARAAWLQTAGARALSRQSPAPFAARRRVRRRAQGQRF